MITISVRFKDCTGKWRYTRFTSREDRAISTSDISNLNSKVFELLSEGNIPEIKYEVNFNRYRGCISGESGVWVRMIDTVRAAKILGDTLERVNSAVRRNQSSLLGRAVTAV